MHNRPAFWSPPEARALMAAGRSSGADSERGPRPYRGLDRRTPPPHAGPRPGRPRPPARPPRTRTDGSGPVFSPGCHVRAVRRRASRPGAPMTPCRGASLRYSHRGGRRDRPGRRARPPSPDTGGGDSQNNIRQRVRFGWPRRPPFRGFAISDAERSGDIPYPPGIVAR